MSDSSPGDRWVPPSDASDGGAPDHPPREETISFSSEATQRIPRDEPPPPPPPPTPPTSGSEGWAPPQAPDGDRAYGPGGWQPPPRPGRRTGVVAGVVIGVVSLVVLLGAGAVLLLRAIDTEVRVDGGVVGPEESTELAPDDVEDVPADDLEAQAEAVLRTINTSEERMIAFQRAVFERVGEDGTVGDAAAEVAQEAQDAGNDLTELRSQLRSLADEDADGFDGLREVRDTYAAHMQAWIDYLDAVAESPALASPESSDAEPLWRDIETTGDDFVTAMESGLPDQLPRELEELARLIVERGFGGGDGPSGDVV